MSIFDVFKAGEIKKENESLKKFIDEIGGNDALRLRNTAEELEQKIENLNQELARRTREARLLDNEINEKRKHLIVLDEDILLESFALYKPKFNFQSSDEYKQRLDLIRQKQKLLIKNGEAVYGSQSWTVNNSKTDGKKMVNDMIKLVLRAFNNECDYCVDHVKFNNIESSEKRIHQSFDALNKLGQIMQVYISQEYKKCKLEELYLAFEYQRKKQEEREEQKKAREELREQQKLEREIRVARERILKEKKHFSSAIKELEARLATISDESEKVLVSEKLTDVRQKMLELDNEEKIIDYREQNAKAGYVYVVSNIGAFGENIYKIGMTRRLEPMDRVDELGDASVPFSFDVHAMIFSENAPDLESKLHQHFHSTRLNKLNNRKEFFRADINEIERIIRENYDQVVDIEKVAPAEQYRESLKIE
jgi:hypothetical protein